MDVLILIYAVQIYLFMQMNDGDTIFRTGLASHTHLSLIIQKTDVIALIIGITSSLSLIREHDLIDILFAVNMAWFTQAFCAFIGCIIHESNVVQCCVYNK